MASLSHYGYSSSELRPVAMPDAPPRHPINIRPTPAQRHWLLEQKARRGISINAAVLLALELAMATEQPAAPALAQAPDPDQARASRQAEQQDHA